MDLALRVNTQGGSTVVRLFKDRSCADSYKTFACTVSCRGSEYRSDIPASELQGVLQAVKSATNLPCRWLRAGSGRDILRADDRRRRRSCHLPLVDDSG